MNILAIETSTKNFSLAVAKDAKKIIQRSIRLKGVLSTSIIPAIEGILKRSDLSLNDLDGLAVGLGPGSFTSLRVGLSTVKGLAFALGKPVVGIPSLDVLAMNLKNPPVRQICVLCDAKRNLVYACFYHKIGDSLFKKSAYLLIGIEELLGKIKADTVFIGDAIPLFKEKILKAAGDRVFFADVKDWYPQAKELVSLSRDRFQKRKFNPLDNLVPLYLYPKDCQVSR